MSRPGRLACPICGFMLTRVVSSSTPWRRRKCLNCAHRFSTTETVNANSASADNDAISGDPISFAGSQNKPTP